MSLRTTEMSTDQRRMFRGLMDSGIRTIVWDDMVPDDDDERRDDEDVDIWSLLDDAINRQTIDGDSVIILMQKAYEQGWNQALYTKRVGL